MELLKQYITEILTAAAGLSAWLFERKKRKQELAAASHDHQQRIMDMYQEALDDLKSRYDQKFTELEIEIKQLRTNLNLWKDKYRNLKSEFEIYKKNHG